MCNKDGWLLNRDSSPSHNHKKFLSRTHPTHRTARSPSESIRNDEETDYLKPFCRHGDAFSGFAAACALIKNSFVCQELRRIIYESADSWWRSEIFFFHRTTEVFYYVFIKFESVHQHILGGLNWVVLPFYVLKSRSGWITWHNITFNSCFDVIMVSRWVDISHKDAMIWLHYCKGVYFIAFRCTLMIQTPSWIQSGVTSGSLYTHEWWIFHAALWTSQGNTILCGASQDGACVSVTHVTHVHALTWRHVSIPLTANSYSVTFQHASRWWEVIPLDNMPDDNPYKTSDTSGAMVITVIKTPLHHKVQLRSPERPSRRSCQHSQSECYHYYYIDLRTFIHCWLCVIFFSSHWSSLGL